MLYISIDILSFFSGKIGWKRGVGVYGYSPFYNFTIANSPGISQEKGWEATV
jgi:hypothetical protein